MKKSIASLLAVVALAAVFGGCNYEAPIVPATSAKPVDEALLGVWHAVPADSAKQSAPQVALIQKFCDKMYLIQYPVQTEDSLYFRGYRVEIDGKSYLQIQLVGTDKGPVKETDRKYDLACYAVSGDMLEMRLLNTQVVPKLGTTDALMKVFLEKKADPALFGEVLRFRRPPR